MQARDQACEFEAASLLLHPADGTPFLLLDHGRLGTYDMNSFPQLLGLRLSAISLLTSKHRGPYRSAEAIEKMRVIPVSRSGIV